jgi:hypothetical protein
MNYHMMYIMWPVRCYYELSYKYDVARKTYPKKHVVFYVVHIIPVFEFGREEEDGEWQNVRFA